MDNNILQNGQKGIFKAGDLMRQICTMEDEINSMNKIISKRANECMWYFSDQEVQKLFQLINHEVVTKDLCAAEREYLDSYTKLEDKEKSIELQKATESIYKNAIQDETFYNLLYYGAFDVKELLRLPVKAYNPEKEQLHWKKYDGSCITLKIHDKKILNLLSLHLEVNKPKKYMFETNGKPLTILQAETMFIDLCEKAEVDVEDKWQCRTLTFTGMLKFISQSA